MPISNNNTGIRPGVCTSTTRPTTPYTGQFIFETDTLLAKYWSGSAWAIFGGGVTSFTSSTGLSTNASATGAVSVTNTGVTSLVAGTNITLSGSTGAVTVNATGGGVTSAVAGTGVSVSASTGAVTFSIGQSVATTATPTFGNVLVSGSGDTSVRINSTSGYAIQYFSINGTNKWHYEVSPSGLSWSLVQSGVAARLTQTSGTLTVASNMAIQSGDDSRAVYGPNSTFGGYLHVGATTDKTANGQAQVISTDGNLHLDSGRNNSIYLNYYSGGRTIKAYGPVEVYYPLTLAANTYIGLNSGVTDANSISCSGWFRPTGQTGIYFQSYGGGWWMTDSTWIRSYGGKNMYVDAEIRADGAFSSNVSRQRGSYGSITIGSNGRSNDWQGIEFLSPDPMTLMVHGDQLSGMYRNNNAWNWLFDYSTLSIGSDERYKRDIEPLSLGLNFIESLEPISYLRLTETPDDDPDATQEGYYYGFTAQNVRTALDSAGETRDVKIHDIGGPNMGLVACTEDAVYDRQYIGITEFIAPIVQAIKELSDKVKALEGAQ